MPVLSESLDQKVRALMSLTSPLACLHGADLPITADALERTCHCAKYGRTVETGLTADGKAIQRGVGNWTEGL